MRNDYRALSERLHSESIVIDGLTWLYRSPAEFLNPKTTTAANLTIDETTNQDFSGAIQGIGCVRQAVRSDSHVTIVETASDIRRAKESRKVGLILGFQHSKFLETDLSRVDVFHRLGVRIIQLTYNDRTYAGDGCLEPRDGGLSRFGRRLIREMNEIGIVVDLSHAGIRTSLEAIEAAKVPPIFSHANPASLTENPRNLTDEQIKAVAEAGGVIGCCSYASLCYKNQKGRRPTLEDFVDHIEYVVNLVGIDHVGLATDSPCTGDHCARITHSNQFNKEFPEIGMTYWEGLFTKPEPDETDEENKWLEYSQPKDIPGVQALHNVTEDLVHRGYTPEDIKKILGENFLRVFDEAWK